MNQWAKVLLASAIVSVSVGVNADTVKDNIFNCNQEIKKGNLEKEYAILMSNDNINKKMVDYFYNFIIDNDEHFQQQEKGVFTESDEDSSKKKI